MELAPRYAYTARAAISIEGLDGKRYAGALTSCTVRLLHEEIGSVLLQQEFRTPWRAGTAVTYCDESSPLTFAVADGDVAAVSDATLQLDFFARTPLPKKALLFKCLEQQQSSTEVVFTADAPLQEVLMTARLCKRFEYHVPGGGRLAVRAHAAVGRLSLIHI